MTYPTLHMLIDGEQVPVGHRRLHAVLNPATGEELGHLPLADAADLDRALDAAQRGFRMWREAPMRSSAARNGPATDTRRDPKA